MGDDAAGAGAVRRDAGDAPLGETPVGGSVWAGCALVVPAGGGSRRMGTDKLAAPLGTSTVLGELLARVPAGVPVVVVGPTRPLPASAGPDRVVVAREDPPGGGPAAAVAAGLRALTAAGLLTDHAAHPSWPAGPPVGPLAGLSDGVPAGPPVVDGVDVLVVLAGDAPWSPLAVPAVVAALRAAPPEVGCAVAVDAGGRDQVLLAAHRLETLRERLAPVAEPAAGSRDGSPSSGHGGAAGRSARWLVGADPVTVAVPEHLLADVDTPEQLAAARARR